MTVTLDTAAPAPTAELPPTARDADATRPERAARTVRAPAASPALVAPPVVSRVRPRRRRLTLPAARLTAITLIAAFVVGGALQPLPNGPEPVLPWWADMLGIATLVTLLAASYALAVGRRSGLWAGLVGSAGLAAQSALCPGVGHHAIAAWWWAQLGVTVGMVALCAGLIRATTPRSPD
jgi:hypothetical protein